MFASLLDKLKGILPAPDSGKITRGRTFSPGPSSRVGVTTTSVTPVIVANALRAAESGDLGQLQELYLRMYAEDAHFKGCVNSLVDAIGIYPIRVSPSHSKTPLAEKAAKMVEANLRSLPMRRIAKSMTLTRVGGVRVYEAMYAIKELAEIGKATVLTGLDLVPTPRYRMDAEKDSKTYGEIRIATDDERKGIPLADLPYGKFIQVDDGTDPGFYDLAGVGRTCLFWWLTKTKNSQWWAEFNEIYGEPVRVGYYDDFMDADAKNELQTFLSQLSRAAWTMLPAEADVQFIEMNRSGAVTTHADIIGLANDEMSKATVGQIGTMGRNKHGSYGEAGVLNSVRFEILSSVAGMIEDAFQFIVRWLCQVNIDADFPEEDLPRVYIVIPNPEEKKVKAEIFNTARHFMHIPAQYAHDELGIPMAREDEDVLPGFGEQGTPAGFSSEPGRKGADDVEQEPKELQVEDE